MSNAPQKKASAADKENTQRIEDQRIRARVLKTACRPVESACMNRLPSAARTPQTRRLRHGTTRRNYSRARNTNPLRGKSARTAAASELQRLRPSTECPGGVSINQPMVILPVAVIEEPLVDIEAQPPGALHGENDHRSIKQCENQRLSFLTAFAHIRFLNS